SGTLIRFFLAASMPLRIASGTSRALPVPNPTVPFSSPTTTSALNDRFLPPLTTFVTRLIAITWSLRSTPSDATLRIRALRLALEAGLAGRLGEALDAAVIDVATATEDHLLDALLPRALGNQLADLARGGDVAPRVAAHRLLDRRRRDERVPLRVVDDLDA